MREKLNRRTRSSYLSVLITYVSRWSPNHVPAPQASVYCAQSEYPMARLCSPLIPSLIRRPLCEPELGFMVRTRRALSGLERMVSLRLVKFCSFLRVRQEMEPPSEGHTWWGMRGGGGREPHVRTRWGQNLHLWCSHGTISCLCSYLLLLLRTFRAVVSLCLPQVLGGEKEQRVPFAEQSSKGRDERPHKMGWREASLMPQQSDFKRETPQGPHFPLHLWSLI